MWGCEVVELAGYGVMELWWGVYVELLSCRCVDLCIRCIYELWICGVVLLCSCGVVVMCSCGVTEWLSCWVRGLLRYNVI